MATVTTAEGTKVTLTDTRQMVTGKRFLLDPADGPDVTWESATQVLRVVELDGTTLTITRRVRGRDRHGRRLWESPMVTGTGLDPFLLCYLPEVLAQRGLVWSERKRPTWTSYLARVRANVPQLRMETIRLAPRRAES